LIQARKGINITTLQDKILDLIPGIDLIPLNLPDVSLVSAKIDEDVLEFKSGKISIASQGDGRIPFFDGLGMKSEDAFMYSETSNRLDVENFNLSEITTSTPDTCHYKKIL
jgi:hypothetical protein